MVNGMRQSLIILMKEPYYNIIIMSTFSCLAVSEGQKEERRLVNVEVAKLKYL